MAASASADACTQTDVKWRVVDDVEEQGVDMNTLDKWTRILVMLTRARRHLNFALVYGNTLKARFGGRLRWRMRQSDQLDS